MKTFSDVIQQLIDVNDKLINKQITVEVANSIAKKYPSGHKRC